MAQAGNPRRWVGAGALLTALGLAVCALSVARGSSVGSAQTTWGGAIVIAGWFVLAWGLHRLGRGR